MAKILHVEDDRDWIDVIRRALAEHHVDSAGSYEAALQYLHVGAPYDLALVDLHLRGVGDLLGEELLDLLRVRHSRTHRIVITGAPPSDSALRTLIERFDVDGILIKGKITMAELRRMVDESLTRDTPVSVDVRVRISELQLEFGRWQRSADHVIGAGILDAQRQVVGSEAVGGLSSLRANNMLKSLLSKRAAFLRECDRLEARLRNIGSLEEAILAAEEFARVQGGFGGDSMGSRTDGTADRA